LILAELRRTRAGALSQGFTVDPLQGLTVLKVFNSSRFLLPGRIPAWFGTGLSSSLEVLDLRSAAVDDELPADLGMFRNLTTLVLSGNNIFSLIPVTLFSIKVLEFLDLSNNNLSEPPKALPSPSKKDVKWKYVLAGVLTAAAILVVLFLVALVYCLMSRGRRRLRGRGVEQNKEGIHSGRRSSSVNPVTLSSPVASPATNGAPKGLPTIIDGFTYDQLQRVTRGFGDENLVKHGHSRDIYRESPSEDCFVPGHLAVDEEELLVYKYMAKGDLTIALHKKSVDSEEGLRSLDWITRLKIAIGVAKALCFLHYECRPPLVYRDIQASNVFLDDKFEVCLRSLTEVCTQQSEGSKSFFSRMLRSSKSLDKNTSGLPASCSYDVYCFGKVLLELITGNFGVSGSNDTGSEKWLASTLGFIDAHDKEALSNIVDPSLVVDEDHLEEVWAVSIVAKTCLNPKPSRRPLARYILKALENPLRVVREEFWSNSSQLRSTSSRSS
ncbi:hypothetical protein ABZP36_019502, partial [Zizania latifolia]